MQTGTYISGAAHVGLIGWALLGGVFRSDPLPFEVTEVSVITGDQFAAMVAAQQPPATGAQPAALNAPSTTQDVPQTAPEAPVPDPAEQAQPEPDQVEPDLPTPDTPAEAEVSQEVATLVRPPDPEPAPPSVTPRPRPRPVDRVAPTPIAPPPPDARPDVNEQTEVAPDEGAEVPQETQDATAPEEAASEIVTEADDTAESLAPASSLRPPARRPSAPVPTAEPAATPSNTDAAINSALAEAQSGQSEQVAPVGPPLNAGEKDALRVAVSTCWNVGSLSSSALATTVVVGVNMTKDGKPVTSSIRMLSSSGGSAADARQAFEAARRAIIRCGSKGFDLPSDKYAHWRDIEMTFNPEKMRIK